MSIVMRPSKALPQVFIYRDPVDFRKAREWSLIPMDETHIQVHKEPGYSATGDQYMWVSLGGPPDKLAVIFDDDPSRGHEVALRLLDGYEGYLQSDGYAGYDAASTKLKLIQLGCWDHCQRKFKEAQAAQPGKTQGRTKADIALDKIRKLYRIEREIKTLSAEEKRRQRQLKESARVTRSKAVERQKQRKIPKRRPDIQSAGLYE